MDLGGARGDHYPRCMGGVTRPLHLWNPEALLLAQAELVHAKWLPANL